MPRTQSRELSIHAKRLLQVAPQLDGVLKFSQSFAARWARDRCPLMAAAMAFYGLVSIFPLMLASVAIISRIVEGPTAALPGFRHFVEGFFPGAAQQILREIEAIAEGTDATTLGLVAIISLLWSGRAYFDTLASVLNAIWPAAEQRSFWRHQVALWSLFVGVGALWLLSTAAVISLSALHALALRLPHFFWNRTPLLWRVLAGFVSWLLTFIMFWLLYRFLPNVQLGRRRQRVIAGAALLGSLGWEAAKWLFTNVIGHNLTRYQATYGSVAGVVLTMVWIYLSSLILLTGAEFAAVYDELCPPAIGADDPVEQL